MSLLCYTDESGGIREEAEETSQQGTASGIASCLIPEGDQNRAVEEQAEPGQKVEWQGVT